MELSMIETYKPTYAPRRVQAGRSNKTATQRAVEHVVEYISTRHPEPGEWTYLNTQVRIDQNLSLSVLLLDKPILVIDRTESGYVDKIFVCSGEFYDDEGNPSNLTRERLNGLLAALGHVSIVPKDVRVCMKYMYAEDEADQIKDAPRLCYIISGDNRVLFNEDYATVVGISPNPDCFTFEDCSHDAGNLG